jgi:hypothetical protein
MVILVGAAGDSERRFTCSPLPRAPPRTARGADRESGDDFANGGFRFRRDLLRRLILNRMLDVDRVEIGSSQCAGLRAGRSHKFMRGDRDRRYPKTF